jgi:CheY-like chemotaxis protein
MAERIALVVDDSRSARFALRKHLEGHAFRVDTADSARAAYAWLQDQRPDLIFLDHVMPEEDGFSALRHLKADPQTATIPVVICSSNEGSAFVAEARSQGAAEVLQKPPSPEQLQRILQQIEAAPPPSPPPVAEPITVEAAAAAPAAAPAPAPIPAAPIPVPNLPAMPVADSVDIDALRNSVETLRGDLGTLQDEGAQVTQALEARAGAIEARLAAIEQRLGSDLANARKHLEKELETLRRHSDKAIDTLRQQHEREIAALREQHTTALLALEQRHIEHNEAQRRQLDTELRVVHEQFREELQTAAQAARQQAVEDMRARLLRALGDGS